MARLLRVMIHLRPPILTAVALLACSLFLRPAGVAPSRHVCIEGTWQGDLLVPPKSSDPMPEVTPGPTVAMPNAFVDTELSGLPPKSLL